MQYNQVFDGGWGMFNEELCIGTKIENWEGNTEGWFQIGNIVYLTDSEGMEFGIDNSTGIIVE